MMKKKSWKLNLGATVEGNGVSFRVWAPACRQVEVLIDGAENSIFLKASSGGYFNGRVSGIGHGTEYRYRLNKQEVVPDPCSRFQSAGPFGPSMVVDPQHFKWSDQTWKGVSLHGQVIYEMHIGTFTQEGTFDAAARELPELKRLGIGLIEVMPIADWPGRWNWGYDGVNYYAPTRCYGDEEALKRFVNLAHKLGIGVILDVVYNHFGPDGNFLSKFSPWYVSKKHHSEWGSSPNFDGPHSEEVRHFFLQNAAYWISEFHLDGLRVDATQSICDDSKSHFLKELTQIAHAAAGSRKIVIIGENEPQNVQLLRAHDKNGYGFDALWSDDFHHTARVALTGSREGYFLDYQGKVSEIAACVKRGFLYQGQYYRWQKQNRGTRTRGFPAQAFVFFLQNHDQTANHITSERLDALSDADRYRALTTLLFVSPSTPMLFMGQEFGSTKLFPYFSDHTPELTRAVEQGRKDFLDQFMSFRSLEMQKKIPRPGQESTFHRAKLDFSERKKNKKSYQFHRDLIALRARDKTIARQSWDDMDVAVIHDQMLVLRFFGEISREERLLIVNLGKDFEYDPISEPLLALAAGWVWEKVLSSNDSDYTTGKKQKKFEFWKIPKNTAVFFKAVKEKKRIP